MKGPQSNVCEGVNIRNLERISVIHSHISAGLSSERKSAFMLSIILLLKDREIKQYKRVHTLLGTPKNTPKNKYCHLFLLVYAFFQRWPLSVTQRQDTFLSFWAKLQKSLSQKKRPGQQQTQSNWQLKFGSLQEPRIVQTPMPMNLLEHSELFFSAEKVLIRFTLDFHKQFMGSLSTPACTGILDTSTYVLLSVSAMGPQITLSSQRGHCWERSSFFTPGQHCC